MLDKKNNSRVRRYSQHARYLALAEPANKAPRIDYNIIGNDNHGLSMEKRVRELPEKHDGQCFPLLPSIAISLRIGVRKERLAREKVDQAAVVRAHDA